MALRKMKRNNITNTEKQIYRSLAKDLLSVTTPHLGKMLKNKLLIEVK